MSIRSRRPNARAGKSWGGQWRTGVQESRELPDGYALRIPSDAGAVMAAAEWITLDRLCCPFLSYTLEIEREGGPVWLRLTGRPGVKEFIQAVARGRRRSANDAETTSTSQTRRVRAVCEV